MNRRRSPVPLVVAIMLGLWLAPTALGLYTDWLWFGETGYRNVYAGILSTQALLGVAAGAGVVLAAALLAYEHSLVRADDLSKLDAAFFTMNGIMSVTVFAFALLDRLVP